jgi:type I site-specific restriction-modification system R (restriction) subunit
MRIRDDVGFFQAVCSVLAKSVIQQRRPEEELDNAIRQIVSRAVSSGEVVDIFAAAGLKKPDISILLKEFLAEVSHIPQKNLAVELLRKLLNDEIKTRSRRNVVKSSLFSTLLESSIRKYQNRAIQAAQVIEELIGLARQMREESAIYICINNAIIGVQERSTYAQTEGERRSVGGPAQASLGVARASGEIHSARPDYPTWRACSVRRPDSFRCPTRSYGSPARSIY